MSEQMRERKQRILEMMKNGKISSDDALDLLNALEPEPEVKVEDDTKTCQEEDSYISLDNRQVRKFKFLKVDVVDEQSSSKVKVNIPLSLAKVGLKLGQNFIPEEAKATMEEKGITMEQIADILENIEEFDGQDIVNVESDGSRVRVYLE